MYETDIHIGCDALIQWVSNIWGIRLATSLQAHKYHTPLPLPRFDSFSWQHRIHLAIVCGERTLLSVFILLASWTTHSLHKLCAFVYIRKENDWDMGNDWIVWLAWSNLMNIFNFFQACRHTSSVRKSHHSTGVWEFRSKEATAAAEWWNIQVEFFIAFSVLIMAGIKRRI